jgi:predicted  nucleic acid-binding Zn-ribbon protein
MSEPVEGVQAQLLTHLIEAAAMRQDIDNLKANQGDAHHRVVEMLSALNSKMEGLALSIQSVPERIAACRNEIRNEVKEAYPDRLSAERMERRIEDKVDAGDHALSVQIREVSTNLNTRITEVEGKVDKQWLKITWAVSIVGTVGAGLVWLVNNFHLFLAASRAAGGQ